MMITSEEIKRRLWNGANELRGSMDASRYKDYMLGLMFYKFLSDKTLQYFKIANEGELDHLSELELYEAFERTYRSMGEDLKPLFIQSLGYFLEPQYLYQRWIKDINDGSFELQVVADSLNKFENAADSQDGKKHFKEIFSNSTINLQDTALGSNLTERSKNIQALINLFADLNMAKLQEGDILGDAYEYLIGMFAMESGKKAGEFYTPRQVSEVMAQIVTRSTQIRSIYDATVGSGSLLLTVGRHLSEDERRDLIYYGQEKNTATYNLCRMNLLLHGVRPANMDIRNGDTLAEDWPEDPQRPNEGVQFDAVVMNPPYSLSNWNRAGLTVSDPRFEIAGVLPPKSKGDFAFLLHGLYHLGQNGTMAIVLPHGVLFRGSSEGEIRKRLLEKNHIDAIIGMPSNLFTNTGIPVVILILKKNRELGEPLLVIDASKDFVKRGKQNALLEKDIARIADVYTERQEIKGYSHLATREEIIENDYNLNIPRYIENTDEEIPHDVEAHLHGGIPLKNLKDLTILQTVLPDVMEEEFETIRPGYVKPKKSLEDFTETILNDERILKRSAELASQTQSYLNKYWNLLREDKDAEHISKVREDMLSEIKALLSNFRFVDSYDGYQVIAEVWNKALRHDMELITAGDFYSVARTREPNMVIKGSGSRRREEQDGWEGAIVPCELVIEELYQDESAAIENKNSQISEIESELSDLVEAAKEEDSDENLILFDCIKRDKEDEPSDAFDFKAVRDELKTTEKRTEEYKLLKKVNNLDSDLKRLKREVRDDEKNLSEAAQNRIPNLTEEEIDRLIYKKWFGSTVDEIVALIEAPIKEEIAVIEMLNERYKDTIADIDKEIAQLTAELEDMMADLVVTYE